MKIALIYLHVTKVAVDGGPLALEKYAGWSRRFYESWLNLCAGELRHDLWVVFCGGEPDDATREMYRGRVGDFVYEGKGWDIGAMQHALENLQEYDLAVCMNTGAFFKHAGFLDALVQAREKYGDGMYGASGSFELRPHIRTTCWAVDPKTFARYPLKVTDRLGTFEAESGEGSITNWYDLMGLPVKVVGRDGVWDLAECRNRENTFRKGDQSNDYVWDRHHVWYAEEGEEMKREFQKRADGDYAKAID